MNRYLFDNCKFIRWIAAVAGWLFGGAALGAIGFIAGAVADNIRINPFGKAGKPSMGSFTISLLTVLVVVMQADGKIVRSELNYAKAFLRQYYSEIDRKEALQTLRLLLDNHPPLPDACRQLNQHIAYHERIQLVNYLFALARSDKALNAAEQQIINTISINMGVNMYSMGMEMSRKKGAIDVAYEDLNISKKATVAEIKQAYRLLAVKYHPDKVTHLDERGKNRAKEQFQKINKAYKLIKTERNFS